MAIRSIEHSGEVTGFVSDNEVLVDDGVAVVVLTNHMAGGAGEIAQLVATTVVGGGAQTDAEKQTLAIYRDLQKGKIDRSLLAPNLNDYFSAQTVADFRDSLAPLGEPLTFKQAHEALRGGMDHARLLISCIQASGSRSPLTPIPTASWSSFWSILRTNVMNLKFVAYIQHPNRRSPSVTLAAERETLHLCRDGKV